MSMVLPPLWPAGVPLRARAPESQATAGDGRMVFPAEGGDQLMRPRTTVTVDDMELGLARLTPAQFDVFRAFVRDDLARATKAFAWIDPFSGAIRKAQFRAGGAPYTFRSVRPYVTVSVNVRIWDMEPWFAAHLTTVNGFLEVVSAP